MYLEESLIGANSQVPTYENWPIDFMSQFMEQKHHSYASEQLPYIKELIKKSMAAHGSEMPELHKIKSLFNRLYKLISSHIRQEEIDLYPEVRKKYKSFIIDENLVLNSPINFEINIQSLSIEHTLISNIFREIRKNSHNYKTQKKDCNTLKSTFLSLELLEKDWSLHQKIEEKILYPKIIELNTVNNRYPIKTKQLAFFINYFKNHGEIRYDLEKIKSYAIKKNKSKVVQDYLHQKAQKKIAQHLKEVEKYLFRLLPSNDLVRLKAENQYLKIHSVHKEFDININAINAIDHYAYTIEKLISFEENLFYPYLQNKVDLPKIASKKSNAFSVLLNN
jgi:regulator of cell morphogenesis and NO signaling